MPVLRPGQRLGPYTIDHLLGSGGMAEVYAATHATLARTVAIKVLNPIFNIDPTFPLRFLREARAVARLHHPNIVTVYDFGEAGEIAYLAMALAPGGTLDRLARGWQTLDDAVAALVAIGDALQYAHDRGIVHRDIKPINVLVDEQGRPLLADFGLARIVSESLDVEVDDEIAGTPQYMAPEQAQRVDVDHRADIYSLGISTYEVLTGRLPYDGPTVKIVLDQHVSSPPPSIRAVWPVAPLQLDAAIRRATAKRPSERYARVGDFIHELQQAAGGTPALPLLPRYEPRPSTVASAGIAPTVISTPASAGTRCATCGAELSEQDRFCRACGSVRHSAGEQAVAPTVRIADGAPVTVASLGAAGPDAVAPGRPRLRRRRVRPTGFSRTRRGLLSGAGLLIVAINAVLAWQYLNGRAQAASAPGGALWTFIWDQRPWFRGGFAAIGLALALGAALMMRRAVLVEHGLSPSIYQRLRQYHRVMGYTITLIAYSVALLTCVVGEGFQFGSTASALHTITGTAVLLIIPLKIATVRKVPRLRRYLPWLGWSIAALFAVVLFTSSGRRVWDHFNSSAPPAYGAAQPGRPEPLPGDLASGVTSLRRAAPAVHGRP